MVTLAVLLSIVSAAGAAALMVPPTSGHGMAGDAARRADPPPDSRPPPSVLRLGAALGAGVAVLLVVPGGTGGLVGPSIAAVAAGAVWWRGRSWESAAARRRREALGDELPHVVDLLTAVMAAGAAPTTALTAVAEVLDGPMGEELAGVRSRLVLGTDPLTVWTSMSGHPELGRLGATLQRSAESGAPVVEALLRLAEDLRAHRRAAVEERVRQVEVKAAVPLGVCLLPSFVLLGVVPLVAGSVSGLLLG